MAHDDHLVCVEFVASGNLSEVAKCAANILKRSRPASTGIADAAIFDIPGGDSFCRESCAEVRSVHQVIFGTPEPTGHHHHRGKWAAALPHADVAKLVRITAVGKPSVGSGSRKSENMFGRH